MVKSKVLLKIDIHRRLQELSTQRTESVIISKNSNTLHFTVYKIEQLILYLFTLGEVAQVQAVLRTHTCTLTISLSLPAVSRPHITAHRSADTVVASGNQRGS